MSTHPNRRHDASARRRLRRPNRRRLWRSNRYVHDFGEATPQRGQLDALLHCSSSAALQKYVLWSISQTLCPFCPLYLQEKEKKRQEAIIAKEQVKSHLYHPPFDCWERFLRSANRAGLSLNCVQVFGNVDSHDYARIPLWIEIAGDKKKRAQSTNHLSVLSVCRCICRTSTNRRSWCTPWNWYAIQSILSHIVVIQCVLYSLS